MAMRKVTRTLFQEDDDDDMGAHSTSGVENEYNLRSRTVICDSCGQPSDRGSGVCSSGGLPEGLVGHSFFMGTNEPRQINLQLKPRWRRHSPAFLTAACWLHTLDDKSVTVPVLNGGGLISVYARSLGTADFISM
ncbi:hypothetical protein INR49_002020 [Caranx melampygus]|nr:hypothetical protein INR49_002020 [Caranx melampygus]